MDWKRTDMTDRITVPANTVGKTATDNYMPKLASLSSLRRWPQSGSGAGRTAAVRRYLPPLRETGCTSLLLSIDGTYRQTDGRTPYRYMDADR